MEGPRPPHESEFPSVVKFLDSELRASQSWSITHEYPTALSEANRSNIRIITERDQVLAHAVIRPMIIKSPAGLIKVAGVGSVVTSSEHRNLGLSSKTIESCLAAARGQACELAILWTNIYDFYRKFGFELAGSETSVVIDRDLTGTDASLKIIEGNKVSAEAIHRLYGQHTVTALRTVEEIRKYLQIPNSKVYTAWDHLGSLKAYAIEGKGCDLTGYIHEWGGGVKALLTLFSHIRKSQGRSITVISPRHSENLIRQLKTQGLTPNQGYLGMIKILNTESLFAKIKRHARNLGLADFVLEEDAGQDVIGFGDQRIATGSEHDMVRLLFGPAKPSEILTDKSVVSLGLALDRILPLDLWVWGWDSV